MNKKIIILAVVALVVVTAIVVFNKVKPTPQNGNIISNTKNNNITDAARAVPGNNEASVKDFVMDSFYEMVDGQPRPQYSLKEITVAKGDLVRIKITVTKGAHDFKIDEYNVYADTQLNQQMTVEFTADKVGEFIYYCTKPGHRQNGHWGTLKVLDN